MKRHQVVCTSIVLVTWPMAGLLGQQKPLEGFNGYVERALREWQVPGVAVAVVHGDSAVLQKGYGVRQVGRSEPVTERTLFEIGSTSKAFSSALLAMLVDDGKLTWDDRVTQHLPWFALGDPWVTREVTLRDLVSHRVGVTGLHNGVLTVSRDEIIRRTRFLEPNLGFRTRYDYSNMMYATAGQVAAHVAGKPWEDLLRERILEPLGMRSTTTDLSRFWDSTRFTHCFYCPLPPTAPGLDQAKGNDDIAMPHMMVNARVTVIPWQSYDNAVSAGSIISNVADLSKWVRLQLGQGEFEGKRLIKASTFAEMHTPQSIITPYSWIQLVARLSPSTHFWAYGMGWRMNDYRGRKIVWHTGGIAGFLAYVGLVPEEHLGIVVLSNGDLGSELLPQSLAFRIIDSYLGAPVRDWSAELKVAMGEQVEEGVHAEQQLIAKRVAGTRPSIPAERWVAHYQNAVYGEVVVSMRNDQLFFEIPNGGQGVMEHWHYDVYRLNFTATNRLGLFATLSIDPNGKIVGMNIDDMGFFGRL